LEFHCGCGFSDFLWRLALFAAIQDEIISRIFQPLWAILDRVYTISGYIAAFFMCVILLITIGQMGSRWLGLTFEGSTEFAGYAMAATSFFALAHALSLWISYPGICVFKPK
jgi:small basic protein